MPHQCPFPVHSIDNRRCYRTGSTPGFVLCLAAIASLVCYAGFSYAAPVPANIQTVISHSDVNDPGGAIPRG